MLARKYSSGFSLIEILLTFSLSTLILSSVLEIYLTSQNNYSMQLGLNIMQDNARLITQLLTKEIQSAGYIGCAKLNEKLPFYNYTNLIFFTKNKVNYYHDKNAKVGTDGIALWHANYSHGILYHPMDTYSSIDVKTEFEIIPEQIILISDCEQVEIVRVKKVSSQGKYKKIILQHKLSKKYKINTFVYPVEMNSYFIAYTKRMNSKGDKIPALYMKDINQQKIELVEGIEDLKIHSNLSSNGISLEFVQTLFIANMTKKSWFLYVAFYNN